MTNRERNSLTGSSARVGRCAMSTLAPSEGRGRPLFDALTDTAWLLAVKLDDQLLLDRRVDDLPGRQGVHEHAVLRPDDLEPGRHRALPGELLGDDERRQAARLLAHLDDVVLAHPVA